MNQLQAVKAEIERRIREYDKSIEKYSNKQKSMKAERDAWKWAECKSLLSFIESLEKEPEVDLEKELDRYLRGEFQQTAGGNFNNYIQVARHFYELGKNARKEK